MKTLKFFLVGFATLAFIMFGCQKENLPEDQDILPSNFKVDIPESISSDQEVKVSSDTIDGGKIYSYLRVFIHVGESSADFVQSVINSIREHGLSQEMSFSFTGDDGRVKNITIVANQEFDGRTWEYKLTMTDAENESNEDGGIAMEIYWNRNPVEGIAIVKMANADVNTESFWGDAMYRVDYTENPATTNGYDAAMTVQISQIPILDSSDRFAIRNLKMFVGRSGDRVDVYGNTDHPLAWILVEREQPGIDWAFVASSNYTANIAVAEVGLPPNYLNSSSRDEILGTYSVKNVLFDEFYNWFENRFGFAPDSASLEEYLHNADSPAFFDHRGFVAAGEAPNDNYTPLVEVIANLTPYNPYEVAHLTINFSASVTTR